MSPRQRGKAFWGLLLATLFTWQHAAAVAVQSRQCRVTSAHVSLLDCLRDQTAEEILVEVNPVVGDVSSLRGAPLHLSRNVTIRGAVDAAHTNDWPILDLNYTPAAVQICGSCVVTLTNLVIKNERRGTGPVYDFFIGQPGSRLRSINTIRVWEVCTPGDVLLKLVKSLRRSALLPNSTAPQDAGLHQSITWKGKVYPDSYRSGDISFDVPATFDEGSTTETGGYAMMTSNSTRLCESYVSPECLAVMSGDACIQEAISMKHRTAPKPPQGQVPAATIAIVVSLIVAFLLAAGLAAWQLKRRVMARRRKGSGPPKGQRGKLQRYSSTGVSCGSDDSMSGTAGSAGPRMGKPLGRTTGWALMDTQTAACVGPVEDSGIELGPLVGAGSFGKVFKGRWNGKDVAVKVIEHSGASAKAVQQEMSMMMSFQHPNIVRAFHCITYVHNMNDESECSGSFAFAASGGVGSVSSTGSRGVTGTPAGTHPADSIPDAAAAGSGASTAAKRALAGHGSRAAASATATSPGGTASTETPAAGGACLCPAASGDAVLTIHEGRACCPARPASCQCSRTGAPTTTTPPESSKGSSKVHFGHAGGSGPQAAQQAPPASCGCGGGTAAAAEGVRGSGGGFVYTTAGSSSSQLAPTFPTDSLGSSVDCRCVAGELRRTHSGGARSTKSTKSLKEPSRRYESWLVLECCDRGSLAHYLSQWPPPAEALVDGDAMLLVLQLLVHAAQGLQELHGQNVVHGDLNARNVLVSSCAEEPCGVQGKLADLGLSRTIRQQQTHRTTNTIGTMNHMPPEMLRSGQMSVCADTYALGIMMWELYTGEEAFQRLQHPGQFFETVVLQDLRPVVPPGMPADYQLLMQHCWATEPSARPKISRVLETLQYMVRQRQQQQQTADGTSSEPGPLPVLLSMPPSRRTQPWQHHMQRAAVLKAAAMGGGLPSGSPLSGILITPSSSDTQLPVLSMHQPIDEDTWPQPDTQQQQQQQQSGVQKQQQQQSAHDMLGAAAAGGGAGGFGFFRSLSGRRTSGSSSRPLDAADTSRQGSESNQGSSSGRLPTFMQGLAHSMRASGMVLREMSFDSRGPAESRGPSWSNRHGSQSSSMGEHPWFV